MMKHSQHHMNRPENGHYSAPLGRARGTVQTLDTWRRKPWASNSLTRDPEFVAKCRAILESLRAQKNANVLHRAWERITLRQRGPLKEKLSAAGTVAEFVKYGAQRVQGWHQNSIEANCAVWVVFSWAGVDEYLGRWGRRQKIWHRRSRLDEFIENTRIFRSTQGIYYRLVDAGVKGDTWEVWSVARQTGCHLRSVMRWWKRLVDQNEATRVGAGTIQLTAAGRDLVGSLRRNAEQVALDLTAPGRRIHWGKNVPTSLPYRGTAAWERLASAVPTSHRPTSSLGSSRSSSSLARQREGRESSMVESRIDCHWDALVSKSFIQKALLPSKRLVDLLGEPDETRPSEFRHGVKCAYYSRARVDALRREHWDDVQDAFRRRSGRKRARLEAQEKRYAEILATPKDWYWEQLAEELAEIGTPS